MLDVKMVRANPDEVRKALQRRGDPTSSLDEFLAVEERRRQLLTEVESRRAERKRASDEIAAVKKAGGDADQAIAAMRALGDQIKEHEAALAETEERLNVMLLELPNLALPDVPDGGEEDSVVAAHGRRRRASSTSSPRTTSTWASRSTSSTWSARPRSAARASSTSRATSCMLQFALVHYALRRRPVQGLPPGDPSRARARRGHVRHRLLPHRPRPGLRDGGRRLPRRHQRGAAGGDAHGGVPRRGGVPDPLRRLLHLLPARGRRRRPRHARHPARAPVRQGRDVQLLRARAERGRAPGHPLGRRGDPAGPRHPLPGGQHRRRRPRRPGGAEVRLRGVAARASSATASSPAAATAPTTRRGGSTPASARRRGRASCTRSTAPAWPSAARSSPSWRTTSRPTAASRCRTSCGRCMGKDVIGA